MHLSQGGSIDSAASATNRSRDTMRKHLQAVFGKTGTHRQAELVALLLGGSEARDPAAPRWPR